MHRAARGALVGGGVGLALAIVRRFTVAKDLERSALVVPAMKSVAEGALAGALVGLVLDRQSRDRAVELLDLARARAAELRPAA